MQFREGREKILLVSLCGKFEKCIMNYRLQIGNWVIWKILSEHLTRLSFFPPHSFRGSFYFHSSFTASRVFYSPEAFLAGEQKPPEALSGWLSYICSIICLYKNDRET